MLNGEKYRDEILKLCEDEIDFGVYKDTNEFGNCSSMSCMDCVFENDSCGRGTIKWILSECKDKKEHKKKEKVLNIDKYRKEILNIINIPSSFAVERDTNNIGRCSDIECNDCRFDIRSKLCSVSKNDWLFEEYKEVQKPIELTEEEYEFLRSVGTGYLAKNGVNVLYLYKSMPTLNKGNNILKWVGNGIDVLSLFDNLKHSRFAFIKPDDAEPWSVRKILDNCRVTDEKNG